MNAHQRRKKWRRCLREAAAAYPLPFDDEQVRTSYIERDALWRYHESRLKRRPTARLRKQQQYSGIPF